MSKQVTHIICVLDRSGSMGSLAGEVIQSFNEFIDEQKKLPGKAILTLITFNHKAHVIHDKVKLSKVPYLTTKDFNPSGMTAIYDAVGTAISANTDDKDVVMLIQTDGMENSSQEYTSSQLQSMIKEKTADDWEFLFMGANIDTITAGGDIGLSSDKTMAFAASSVGIKAAYNSMSSVSADYRMKKIVESEENS